MEGWPAAHRASADGANRIRTIDLEQSFEEYSQGRVQDTINEFKSELPDLERLLVNMKPNKVERRAALGYVYKTDDLIKKIKSVCELGRFNFRNGLIAEPKDLAAFLYKINFLTARKVLPSGEIHRKYFEENRIFQLDFQILVTIGKSTLPTGGPSSQTQFRTYTTTSN
jgi:hypothetical protein